MQKNKPKVLFFGKLPPPFIGPALATKIILSSELKNRYELIHFDISHHKSIADLGRVHWYNFVFPLMQYFRLLGVLWSENPDLVYIPSQQTTVAYLRDLPYYLIVRLFGIKLVCHLRGGYFGAWYSSELGALMRSVVRLGQKMVHTQLVLGQNLRTMYASVMPMERIAVVPNGADYSIPERSRSDDMLRVVYLGNYIRTKGILHFLEAAVLLKEETRIEFHCWGSDNEPDTRAEMNRLAALSPRIFVHNAISGAKKFQALADADVFVFPTFYRNEGHPWVIIEAMAAGLPVIATARAAIPETVEEDINGFLVAEQSAEAIAQKIVLLKEQPALRTAMGLESRRLYEQNFTEAALVRNFDKVFRTVLKLNS